MTIGYRYCIRLWAGEAPERPSTVSNESLFEISHTSPISSSALSLDEPELGSNRTNPLGDASVDSTRAGSHCILDGATRHADGCTLLWAST